MISPLDNVRFHTARFEYTPRAPAPLGLVTVTPQYPPAVATFIRKSGVALPNVVVQFGGVSATVEFAGEVQIGLYQINAIVPAGLSGDVLLTVTVDGVPVAQTLYITLQ